VAVRATDLLGSLVVDADGAEVGVLRDLRVDAELHGDRLRVRWLLVGGHELAHRFGYVDGRTRGPWLLERMLRRGGRDTGLAVRAESVQEWTPGRVVLTAPAERVAVAVEEAAREW
jgi:sporulation protein YlmC with PRC-barrel domain